jgi:hypothetical protein
MEGRSEREEEKAAVETRAKKHGSCLDADTDRLFI